MHNNTYNNCIIGNGKTFRGELKEATVHANVLRGLRVEDCPGVLVGYAPPVPLAASVANIVKDHSESPVHLVSQSISWKRNGMDTGGVCANSLTDLGLSMAIVNHSESKQYLKHLPDYYRLVSLQISNALENGLNILMCCGEEKGDHSPARLPQLHKDISETLSHLSFEQIELLSDRLLLCYEPGGVIGTGKAAPISQIKQAYEEINSLLTPFGLDHRIRLLYGGGVSLSNIDELCFGLEEVPDHFGYLVGEASTRAEEFVAMTRRLGARNTGTPTDTTLVKNCKSNGRARMVAERPVVSAITPQGKTRIAIVGFGEIGVTTAIACAQDPSKSIEVVQIFNRHISPEDALARVVCSRFVDREDVTCRTEKGQGYVRILDQDIKITAHESMEDAASKLEDIDVVVFTIGEFTKDAAFMHPFLAEGGAKAVLVTCASPAADVSMIPGYNHDQINLAQDRIIALGSCTGNCAVPILSVIEDLFGEASVRGVYAVAPHSKTNTQELGNKGMETRHEGLLGNLLPTETGLSKLLQKPGFFEMMSESIEAISIRTPTEDASLLCLAADIEGADIASTDDVIRAFHEASKSARWNGILDIDPRAHGTKQYWKDTHACVVFEPYTRLIHKYLRDGSRAPLSTVTVLAAYANVRGYSSQVVRAIQALKLGRIEAETIAPIKTVRCSLQSADSLMIATP